MLQHCYNGTNFFTGETTVRIDYIALHKKGGGYSLPILQQEIQTVIKQHQDLLLGNPNSTINYTLLSNDNAFLSYHPHPFTQRTLTARFQVNNTHPPHVQLIRKPVLTVMGLLALLGDTQVLAQVLTSGGEHSDTLGVLASSHRPAVLGGSDSWQTAVLVYNSDDNSTSNHTDEVTVSLKGLAEQKGLVYVTYYMDNNVTNPYQLWQSMGGPDYPTAEQFRNIRNVEDPRVDGPFKVPAGDTLTLKAKLPVPSILLVHICAQPRAGPDQVNGVRFTGITEGQVLILWSDHCVDSKCIKTFEVEFSTDKKKFRRINVKDTIFTSYVYSPVDQEVRGLYRVRAVDYWGRPGPYSLPERFTKTE
uniref:Iduronidase, alpha-L n=1 Tax=Nothobranchius rachovii TaxID=451742 RepID=A0A1A8QHH7_9TELE